MSAFLIVLVVVAVGGLAIALAIALSTPPALSRLGRRGSLWFDRREDQAPEDAPNEDRADPPLPRRPLRGRPF